MSGIAYLAVYHTQKHADDSDLKIGAVMRGRIPSLYLSTIGGPAGDALATSLYSKFDITCNVLNVRRGKRHLFKITFRGFKPKEAA